MLVSSNYKIKTQGGLSLKFALLNITLSSLILVLLNLHD